MNKLTIVVLSLLMVLTGNTYAQHDKFDVKCYSNNALILDKSYDDIRQLDGLLVLKDGRKITFTNGNCVIEYVKPIHKRKK